MQLPLPTLAAGTSGFPTNLSADRHPIHRWFNFIAGFSPEFVAHCIDEAPAAEDGYLLDPFSGTGTALVEAQLRGLPSRGYEPHPFFAEMSRAKLSQGVSTADVHSLHDRIAEAMDAGSDPSSVWTSNPLKYLRKLLPEASLKALAPLPALAHEIEPRLRPMFHLIVSRVLEGASGSATDGVYKAPTTRKTPGPVRSVLRLVCHQIADDIRYFPVRRSDAVVIDGPATGGVVNGVSLCVTSPPYLNNFDFAEMTRMELYFWRWAESWSDITQTIRSKLLVNTTTAPHHLRLLSGEVTHYLPPRLRRMAQSLFAELEPICKGRSKDYHRLVFPYLSGLYAVFQQVHDAMDDNAPIHVIVADSAFYGIHVPLHELTAVSLVEAGFANVSVTHLRDRGDRWILDKRKGPPGKLGEYWIKGVR